MARARFKLARERLAVNGKQANLAREGKKIKNGPRWPASQCLSICTPPPPLGQEVSQPWKNWDIWDISGLDF